MRYLLSYTAQQASGVKTWARDREHVEKAFNFGGMPARNGVTVNDRSIPDINISRCFFRYHFGPV